jgi:hypothetical protein
MSEEPKAEQPAEAAPKGRHDNDNKDKKGGRRNRQQKSTKPKSNGNTANATAHVHKEKLAGRSEDLQQGFIYDVTASKGGVSYTRTTEEIARHVGQKYNTVGSYIRTAVLTLIVPSATRPTAPATTPSATAGDPPITDPAVEYEIFKEKIRMYVKTEAAIETAMMSLYDLLWGQCSETLRSRLKGNDDFAAYSASADSIALLKSI